MTEKDMERRKGVSQARHSFLVIRRKHRKPGENMIFRLYKSCTCCTIKDGDLKEELIW